MAERAGMAGTAGADHTLFGGLLREARRRALLTLENLSEVSGVSVRAISDMERGKSLPRQATLGELMDALELGEDERRRLIGAARRREADVPRQLPQDLRVFRGRDEALARVDELASRISGTGKGGQVVISAIGGMAGVGKTALAVHWAHRVADRFPDGQLYVNLRGYEDFGQPLDPQEALGGFLSALSVASADMPVGTEARSAMFRERAASRRLVVVLDNARDAEQVRPLLPEAPGCLTLITSRDRLSGLAAREGAFLLGLDVWTREEALSALAARIGEERCRAEPEAAADLVDLCGRLPLAIAVVGAQLSVEHRIPLRVAVGDLRESRPGLDAFAATEGRADLRSVFSRSYRALAPETAWFFRFLAIHPGPAMSAEAAASLSGLDMTAARRHLRSLASASLLSRDADGRYVLHDLVRAYGHELLEREGDDRAGAEIRLLDYLRHNAHACAQLLSRFPSPSNTSPAPGVVRVPIDSREAALDWYRQEDATVAAAVRTMDAPALLGSRTELVLEWGPFYAAVGHWTEMVAATRTVLDAALANGDAVSAARINQHLGRALIETGDLAEAGRSVDLLLGGLDRLPPHERLTAERHASFVRFYEGRHQEGIQYARSSLAIARTLTREAPGEVERSLAVLSWFLVMVEDHDGAITTCEEVLPLLRKSGNRHDEAAVLDNLGFARQRLGDLDAAIADHRSALALYEELLDTYNQAVILDHLAEALAKRGDSRQARADWIRSADLFDGLRVARAGDVRAKAEALPEERA